MRPPPIFIVPDQGAVLGTPGFSTLGTLGNQGYGTMGAPGFNTPIMPPGLGVPNGTMLPPSVSPQISSTNIAATLVGEQIEALAVSMERAAMYSGEIENHFKAIKSQSDDMNNAAVQAVKDMQEQAKRGVVEIGKGLQGVQSGGYKDAPDSGGRPQAPAGVPEGHAGHHAGGSGGGYGGNHAGSGGQSSRFRDLNFAQGRDMGGNLSDLRKNVASRTNQWMSEWGDRQKPATNATGQYVDENGAVTHASAKAGADWEKGMSRIGRAQGVVNALGGGEGLSGLLGELGSKVAGPVGLAVGAGNMINHAVIGQRAANNYYKNIYGGSDADALGQRAQEWGFSHFGTLGLMDSKEADQLFKGVSAMGLQGDKRQSALDFATGQYGKNGMQVGTSLELIQQAASNGVTSMNDFSYALDQVGEAAAKSGKSLNAAQAAFSSNYGMLSSSFSNNTSTAAIASGITSMQQGLGHRLGNLNFGAMVNTTQQQRLAAAALGMDPAQFEMQAQTNQNNVLGRGIDAKFARVKNQGLNPGSTDQAGRLVAQYKASHSGTIDENGYGDIGRQILSSNGNSPERAMAQIQAMGLPITDAEVPEFIARLASGDSALNATSIFGQANSTAGQGYNKDQSTTVGTSDIKGSHDWFGLAARHQNVALAKELGIKQQDGIFAASGWAGKSGKSTNAYFDSIHEHGGKRYKSIENLLRGGGIGDDSKIKVLDKKSGKMVDVSLEQAIKYHKDELEAGNVQITAGVDKGKTVGEVTGVHSKAAAAASTSAADSAKNVNVILSAKGSLKNFIDMQVNGGSGVDDARRSGVPTPPFTSPWNLATGATP